MGDQNTVDLIAAQLAEAEKRLRFDVLRLAADRTTGPASSVVEVAEKMLAFVKAGAEA